jgi:predicted nucleic acid-binding protein
LIYWDTACVLKLYTPEPDSAGYLQLAGESDEPLASSELLSVELAYALHQKELRGALKPGSTERVRQQFVADIAAGRWLLVPVGSDVLVRAAQVAHRCYHHHPPVSLRTVDGLHLATALVLKTQRLVTTDQRLRQAASLFGLVLVTV